MARWKKTSSEDKAKVITAKIKNPDLSLRDIEKETGVKRDTNKRILDEDLPEVATSSDKMINLVDVNISIMTNWKKVIERIVKDVADNPDSSKVQINWMSDVKSLSGVLEDAFKQNQLLTWGATDRIELPELDEKQKALIAKRFKS